MLNKFEHLPNGITCILVKSGKNSPFQKAYISSEDFEKVNNATTEWWSLWKAGKPGVVANVNGKYMKMSRVIMGVHEDSTKIVVQANGNNLDLRRGNLMIGSPGSSSKGSFKSQIQKNLKKLPQITEIQNEKEVKDSYSKPNPITSRILHIEKNIITDQISFTVGSNKRVLSSLSEKDAKALIDILEDLNVTIG